VKTLLNTIISLLVIFTLSFAPVTQYNIAIARAEEPTAAPQNTTPPPAATEPPSAPTPAPAATQPPMPVATPAQAATPKPAATAKPPAGSTAYPTSSPTTQQPATPRPAKTAIPSVLDEPPDPSTTPYATPTQGITTGGQKENSQTGDGSVKTGDASINGTLINNVNTNLSGVSANSGGTSTSSNSGNGTASDNSANTNISTSSDQALANSANLTNNVEVGAVSGVNSASRNTGDGEVVTGDANVGVTVINGANNNISGLAVNQYDVNGNQSGDIVLGKSSATASCGTSGSTCSNGVLGAKTSNTANGDSSNNNANSNNSNSSATTLSNDADVVNEVVIDAVTGGNKADSNVGSGSVETGDANVAVTVLNFLNNNIVAGTVDVINIFGDYVGNIIIPESSSNTSGVSGNNASGNNASGNYVSQNAGNGDSASSNASANSSNTNTTTQANLADIDNNLNVTANTGNNKTQSNTNGDNAVQTGSTNVDANVYNVANVNSTNGGYIVLVNDNGTWKGTIYGASGDKASSEGVQFVVQPDGTVVASNNGNGTASDNNASTNTSNNTSTSQTNNAQVQNNVKINADTGNNSASRNTDGGSVKTGNVNVAASIMNFVNNNFVGQTFRVVLVNVMGKWTGNVVPPGQKAPSPAQGGAQQIAQAPKSDTSATPKPSASTQPLSTAQPAQVAQNTNKTARVGKVLGKMTMNEQNTKLGLKNSAEIMLSGGQKYYVDDTLAIPQDKPIIAAAVGPNKQANAFGNYLIYSAGLVPLIAIAAAVAIRKRKFSAV